MTTRAPSKPRTPRIPAPSAPASDPLAKLVLAAGLGERTRVALAQALASHLVDDHYAKLDQAGHTEDEGIPLRKVFVDLHTTTALGDDDAPQSGKGTQSRKGLVGELLAMPPTRLGDGHDAARRSQSARRQRHCAGFVLVGGPGQGKSTLGQLACQMHRVALLEHLPTLTQAEKNVVADFTQVEARKELGQPKHPSLPVHIVLPDAAAWIGEQLKAHPRPQPSEDAPWLLRFWCSRLPDPARSALSAGDVRTLMKAGPFLLVLDGLDEVPAAEARQRVLESVSELGRALAGAVGLVLATTRPQGYAGELDTLGIRLETRRLALLTSERALIYAKRLIDVGPQNDGERAKILARMQQASAEPATLRLMTTPLQVSILAALLRQGGPVPRERWNLFKRYYEVMYAREVAKPTDAAELLNSNKRYIDEIHARAGLLLQVESENAERSSALLTQDRLEAIVDAVLREEGFDNNTRPGVVERIVKASAQRLIFLVQSEEGKFGFEIRSLQEFMAARALTEKSDADTKSRLLHIAKSGSFRNVTLFVAGKLFAETGDLRAFISGEVCPALEGDSRDVFAKKVAAGALLALDILEDGTVFNQPKHAEKLMRVALGLVDLAPNLLQARLAGLLLGEDTQARKHLEAVLRDGLQVRLQRETTGPVRVCLGAWLTLLLLLDSDAKAPDWAEALADSAWPAEPTAQRAIVEACVSFGYAGQWPHYFPLAPWLSRRIDLSLAHFSAKYLMSLARYQAQRPSGRRPKRPEHSSTRTTLEWLFAYSDSRRLVDIMMGGRKWDGTLWSVRNHPSHPLGEVPSLPSTPEWKALGAVVAFARQPSGASLAAALRAVVPLDMDSRNFFQGLAPWPLQTALLMSSSVDDIQAWASAADAGELGDAELWSKAEDAWGKGIALDDVAPRTDAMPWDLAALLRAPPMSALLSRYPHMLDMDDQADAEIAGLVRRLAGSADPSAARILLPFLVGTVLSGDFKKLFEQVPKGSLDASLPTLDVCADESIAALLDSGALTPDAVDRWGSQRRPMVYRFRPSSSASPLATLYKDSPSRLGLLHLLSHVGHRLDDDKIPAELLDRERFPEPRARADAWLVRLRWGMVRQDELPVLLQDMEAAARHEPHLLARVVPLAGALEPAVRDDMLIAIAGSDHVRAASAAVTAMVHILQARTSGLNDADTWDQLALPLPRPSAFSSRSKPGPGFPGAPVHIESLVLQNMRSVEHIELKMTPPRGDVGQWIVLLGENGTGKSTVLRAILFALRNLADPKIWPKGTFVSAWRRFGTNPETEPCRVVLRLANARLGATDYETTVRQNGRDVFYQSPLRTASSAPPCLLWAYGARRGSALGGASREVDTSEDDGPDIATLFDEGAALVHAQTWLTKLDGEARRDTTGRAKGIYDAVVGALRTILEVETIELDPDSNVLVTGERVGKRVPMAALSDGYLTTAGWVIDLLARWLARATEAKFPVEPNFVENISGLVLVDEIDLHLHPQWQIDVISRARRIFRRLSFVVTTHNPMTIVAAQPQEIWILRRDPGGAVRVEQKQDIPATLTAAQIYGRFFGSEGFFPAPTGQKLQRYGFLCGNAFRSDEEQREMEGLRKELEGSGVVPGWLEIPRAAPDKPERAPAKRRERRV